jgi:hypothetical protein
MLLDENQPNRTPILLGQDFVQGCDLDDVGARAGNEVDDAGASCHDWRRIRLIADLLTPDPKNA